MRRLLCCLLAGIGSALFLSGCFVSQTVRLQNLDVSGPHNHPPIHLQTDSIGANLTISPRLDFSTGPRISGMLPDAQGIDTGGIVHWSVPDVAAGIDADLPVTRALAFSLGGTFADGLWGAHTGMALRFWGKGIAGRFEAGLQWQSVSSHARYLITSDYPFGGAPDSVIRDRNIRQTHTNWYGAVTLNTHFPDAVADVFVQLGFVKQTLFSLELLTPFEENTDYSSSSVILTPGVAFELGPGSRLLLGARVSFENRIEGVRADPKVLPFVQVDFGL